MKKFKIAANSLWPRTTIATDAIRVHFPEEIYKASRTPAIIADAAYWILQQPSEQLSGQFFIDEDILRQQGITDFSGYAVDSGKEPYSDLFI